MEINRALEHLSEIHSHLTKSEVYRGITSIPVAISGIIALVAASSQDLFVDDPVSYVIFWASVAGINLMVGGAVLLYKYLYKETEMERKRTLRVASQFLPSIVAGLIVTFYLTAFDVSAVQFLPGIWSLLFGLGILSARPYLPTHMIWAVAFYFLASIKLFMMASAGYGLNAWGMGLTFALGQLIAAGVLYWSIERQSHVG